MNREIKFRAWQKYHKKMLEVLDIGFKDGEVNYLKVKYPEDTIPNVVIYKKNDEKFWLDDDCIKLMQYTGLKDKNGREIYEGDIVSSYVQTGKESSRSIIVWEDEESSSGWNIKVIKDFYPPNQEGCIISISRNDVMDYEVIGNIYENPELLEVDE